MNPPAVDSAAHVVQLALTPIFLLSGVAAPFNVFSTRLSRILDQVDKLAGDSGKRPRQLARLRLRSRALKRGKREWQNDGRRVKYGRN